MHSSTHTTATMRDEDFFQQLGQRIAALRQQRGLSQAALAQQLGLKQQAWATYESATRRLPSSLLMPTAQALGVTLDELMAVELPKGKRGPVPKLQRQLDAVTRLPKPEQQLVSQLLEKFVGGAAAKAG
jgi:transcriptional regulator with XRE-family HTH domain